MEPDFRRRNDASLARLRELVGRLTPADLDRPLGEGWTVKAALAHLAFWDRYAAAAVQRWQRAGYAWSGPEDPFVNLAGPSDWLAAPPDYVLREVLRAAEAADAAAAGVGETLLAAIVAGGEAWACERCVHHLEHVDQIGRALTPER